MDAPHSGLEIQMTPETARPFIDIHAPVAQALAAGRPVVEQDTGFGDVLPLGPGLHAFRTVEDAAHAVRLIEADYDRASAHATEVAREYFAAEKVLGRLLREVGL